MLKLLYWWKRRLITIRKSSLDLKEHVLCWRCLIGWCFVQFDKVSLATCRCCWQRYHKSRNLYFILWMYSWISLLIASELRLTIHFNLWVQFVLRAVCLQSRSALRTAYLFTAGFFVIYGIAWMFGNDIQYSTFTISLMQPLTLIFQELIYALFYECF